MKTIGLIGGMSWVSSMEYYKIINETMNEKLGGLHSARSIMYSIDLAEIGEPSKARDWEIFTNKIVKVVRNLENSGAEFLVICTNTVHKIADEIQAGINIPLLHIADATAEQILKKNLKKVGLLGTKPTMTEDFYKKRLKDKFGIEVVVPNQDEMETIHNVIFTELVQRQISDTSKRKFKAIIENLVAEGAQGIILGCTEIPLLVKQEDIKVPIFDTTTIHAKAAVDFALS